MKFRTLKVILTLLCALTLSLGLGLASVHAQGVPTDSGLEVIGETTGLGQASLPTIIAQIINVALSVLGIIVILFMIYGGFLWMTAGGSEEQVARAKRIIIQTIIGLAIILASWGIATFVLQAISKATGTDLSGTATGSGGGGGGLGGGSATLFQVTAHQPVGSVAIRNVVPQITFSKLVDATTINDSSIVFTYAATGAVIPGSYSTFGNRVSFTPDTTCPAPNDDRFCFDEFATVNVTVSTAVRSTTGVVLSCANGLCSSSFETGDLIDTEAPVASVTLPDDFAGVPTDSFVDVQVHGTDDAGVAAADFAAEGTVFDSVPAAGIDTTDVLIDSSWDTTGLATGTTYQVAATVIDYAGNTDTDTVTVRMRPATCFDGIIDGIETGIDCGGDSTSPDYCGACTGSTCTGDADCSSGSCIGGVCVALPEISAVSPSDGAPGTYVTLSGKFFGSATGTVEFTGAAGPVVAPLVTCGDAWSTTQAIVQVPIGAVDGPITLTTTGGLSDATDDTNGPLILDFDVNTVAHPGLCSLAPNKGAVTDAFTVNGNGLGTSRGASVINFDSTEVGSYIAWSDAAVNATVPTLPDGVYNVAATVGGVTSNSLEFLVASTFTAAPSIVSLTPSTGGINQYVTVAGSGFGTSVGTVWFENRASGERAVASTSFPAECTSGFWSDNEIIVIVPKDFGTGGALTLGGYDVMVTTSGGVDSNSVPFTVTADTPTPGLCAAVPDAALAGEPVSLIGDNFGTSAGQVTFFSSSSATINAWSDGVVDATVPVGARTGPVVVTNKDGDESNPINFSVSADFDTTVTTGKASYAWSFSSGLIPEVPEVVFACSASTVSGVPNDDFTTGGVCVNAIVFAEFTTLMTPASLPAATTLYECTGGGSDPCSATTPVATTATATDSSISLEPVTDLKPSTTYQVVITKGAVSDTGVPLAAPVTWSFTTKADATPCDIEKVLVSPKEATITELNGTKYFTSLPVNGCMVLSAAGLNWNWSVNPSYARFNTTTDPLCTAGNSTCALAQGLAEGETPVTATETTSSLSDSGTLTINFADPYITNAWPNCTEACVNADVGASFNIPMDPISVERAGAVELFSCANELCTSLTPEVGVRASCVLDASGECRSFHLVSLNLKPSTYYRVVVSGTVESLSGTLLTRTNYGADYSWTFKVRDDASLCAVERISISPDDVQLHEVGDSQAFSGEAWGEADSCSVSGQKLSGFDYAWSWANPIEDQDIDSNPATRVASWYAGGLVDTSPDDIAPGCTSACTPAGSLAQVAVCGDGRISLGEECEDGNILSGDGCSANCLREGTTAPTCGNGVVNQTAGTGAGEDCDDGNLVDGDGCSSTCLAEGSSSVGATCGNSDVAVISSATLAGEECDDGNALRGDGCSSQCLWEGSPTLAELGGSVCGNGGAPERPAEECEDGNLIDGDGCSSQCLWEGSVTTCGLGGIDYGEACDDGNAIDGDGCSSGCLLEGSSSDYATPSFCGDGLVGIGEYPACEAGVSGDGKVDPVQVAQITSQAVYEIDSATKQALATIEVEELASGLTTQANLSLACTADNDSQCLDPNNFGAGTGGCCVERPTVTLFPNGSNVCRNAALYGIFTQQMDTADFTYQETVGGTTVTKYRMYARLDLASSGGVCPESHTTLAIVSEGPLLRFWHHVVRFFTGRLAQADTGDCVTPIVNFQQSRQSDGTYKVKLLTNALLVANGRYSLVVEGDNAPTDTVTEGVKSAFGVGINGTQIQDFVVGTEICDLDAVNVLDTDTISPYVFTQGKEQHIFIGEAISYSTGVPQEIQPVAGVYDWQWTEWADQKSGQIVDVVQSASEPDKAAVTAAGDNGEDTVLATVTVTDDTGASTLTSQLTGSAEVTAFLCENPWPMLDQLPWSDDTEGIDVGAELGVGWTNFSTMYCRDAGVDGTEGDLPPIVVVRPPITASASVFKEYLFEVASTADAIGVRVVSNPSYLSPAAWYAAQGFTGRLSQAEVDAFAAVKDGRTTYISAPNQDPTGNLYPNIYVISYNEGASQQTIDIYNQMVDNLRFAINVSDTAVCDDATNPDCNSDREHLRRDLRRLTDITDIQAFVEKYQVENDGLTPTLPAGTFIPAISSSIWGSWNEILGGALGGNLPADPINAYVRCGDASGPFAAYDAQTCVNSTQATYVCPAGSHAYHYRSVGTDQAYLYAGLEYDLGQWLNPIDTDLGDAIQINIATATPIAAGFTATDFCSDTNILGVSTTCGDGIVGGGEVCEIGDPGGSAAACVTAGGAAGVRNQTCNSTCSAFVDDPAAACVPATCGNGLVELTVGEQCDDGSLNGNYGFCGFDCRWGTALYCGDGSLAGGEACDCGALPPISVDARAYQAGPGTCTAVNGAYTRGPNAGCAWDCSGPAPYCGDNHVDAGEVCDGNDATWAGKLCSRAGGTPASLVNQPCETNADCGGGSCGAGAGRAACPIGTTRVKACDDSDGGTCTYPVANWATIACTDIGSCGDGVVDPDEACDDGNTDGTDGCTATCQVNVCGDGSVYAGVEQCDEGIDNGRGCDSTYGSTCTACSLSCKYEVLSGEFCGDGQINGTEYCDATSLPYVFYNATVAAPEPKVYGTCSPEDDGDTITHPVNGFTYTCRNAGICNGLGAYNGDYCLSSSECGGGTCVKPVCGDSCGSSCPFTYESVAMQLLTNQPGAKATESVSLYSYSDDSTAILPNAATIKVPVCRAATGLTANVSLDNVELPTTYIVFVTDLSKSMGWDLAHSWAATSGQPSRLDLAKEALPEAIGDLFDALGDRVRIASLGVRGLVKDQCFYNAADTCTADGLDPCAAGDFCNLASSYTDASVPSDPQPGVTFGYQMGFVGPDQEADLLNEIDGYVYDEVWPSNQGHGTFTYDAMVQVKALFDDIKATSAGDNARYIAILLHDGEYNTISKYAPGTPQAGIATPDPITIADDFDAYLGAENAGYEVYTAGITVDPDDLLTLKNWSSNSWNGLYNSYNGGRENSLFNGLDYAYQYDPSSGSFLSLYEQIVNSITQIAITVISDEDPSDGLPAVTTTGTVAEGNNVELPWPAEFNCNGSTEQDLPIQIVFSGQGKIDIDNVRLDYCAP